jgi:hypothetical protein
VAEYLTRAETLQGFLSTNAWKSKQPVAENGALPHNKAQINGISASGDGEDDPEKNRMRAGLEGK